MSSNPAAAQSPTATESVLASFCAGGAQCPYNASPNGLVQAGDGNFYGVTNSGGLYGNGSFFTMTPAGAVTDLYDFCNVSGTTCTDGQYPTSILEGGNGNFYGITQSGGAYGSGTLFKISSGGSLTTLHSFCSQNPPSTSASAVCSDGQNPVALVEGSDGSFYGLASYGGNNTFNTCFTQQNGQWLTTCSSGDGTAFKLTASGTFTTLHSFCSQGGAACADGVYPYALLQGSDGSFYGVTGYGGSGQTVTYYTRVSSMDLNGAGTVFALTPAGALSTLYTFCKSGTSADQCADGAVPNNLVEGADGNLYGTTLYGGTGTYANAAYGGQSSGAGTAFKLTLSGNQSTTYNFCSQSNCNDGGQPIWLIAGSDGNFYGLGYMGGSGSYGLGTAVEISPAGAFTNLYSFCTNAGTLCTDAYTPDTLVQGSDGNFYGASYSGGTNQDGAIFKLALSPALSAPVQLTLQNNQIRLGEIATLNWQVLNGASATLQQCYANLQGGASGAGTWSGRQSGTTSNGGYSGSASITPTAEGTFTYALTCGGVESGYAILTVGAAQPLAISTTSLGTGTMNVAYTQALQATGGVQPYTWSIVSGSLPAGLGLNASTGAITGTPTVAGTATFGVQVKDSASSFSTTTANVSITVTGNPAPVVVLSVSPTSGLTYGQTVTLTATETPTYGIAQGYTWTIYDGSTALVSGALPNTPNGFTTTTPPLTAGTHSFNAVFSSTRAATARAHRARSRSTWALLPPRPS